MDSSASMCSDMHQHQSVSVVQAGSIRTKAWAECIKGKRREIR